MPTLAELTQDHFEPLTGTSFRLKSPEDLEPLRLDEVESLPGQDKRSFSLIFTASHQPHLPQKMYPIEHEAIGEHAIFIVPLGPSSEGRMRYQAVFNRG